MTWRTPDWWTFTLLALGAYRLLRLATLDDITHRVRILVYGMTDRDYADIASAVDELEQQHIDAWHAGGHVVVEDQHGVRGYDLPPRWRFYLAKLGHCPFCASIWWSFLVWQCWLHWPHPVLVAMIPLALAAVASLVAARLDQ